MRILFLHGWTSVPGGLKPTYLKEHGHEVINPALPDDDFDEAVRIAQAEFDQHQPDVIVGSSRGGAELLEFGLLADHARAVEVQRLLRSEYPKERHADCDVWAIWQMTASV